MSLLAAILLTISIVEGISSRISKLQDEKRNLQEKLETVNYYKAHLGHNPFGHFFDKRNNEKMRKAIRKRIEAIDGEIIAARRAELSESLDSSDSS